MELILKQSWDLITIKEYMDYKCILDDPNVSDFEKHVNILSVICGVEKEVLYKLPANQILPLFNRLEFLTTSPTADVREFYTVGGVTYRLLMDVKELTAGQFIDLSHYTKDTDLILDNVHLICSVLMLPVKKYKGKKTREKVETEKYMETPIEITSENLYNNMPIREALGISSFFTMLYSLFIQITQRYLEVEQMTQLNRASKILNESIMSKLKPQTRTGSIPSGNG